MIFKNQVHFLLMVLFLVSILYVLLFPIKKEEKFVLIATSSIEPDSIPVQTNRF